MRALEACATVVGCDTTKDRLGYLLDLISTEYLATNGGLATVQEYIGNVESVIGLKLIAYDPKTDQIVYGGETLDGLSPDAGNGGAEDEEEEPEESEESEEAAPAAH
jgi:hypothetical protein